MNVKKQEYQKLVSEKAPKSPILKDCLWAFFVGGFICALGQFLLEGYKMSELDLESAKTLVSVTLIFIAAALTAIGVFDKIAKHAGAGTAVPITGFANSVVSPAVEFSLEGKILGTGAKMFNLAGPVIVYGCSAASLYGLIYWIIEVVKS